MGPLRSEELPGEGVPGGWHHKSKGRAYSQSSKEGSEKGRSVKGHRTLWWDRVLWVRGTVWGFGLSGT